MPATLNKQPIFTATPISNCIVLDPKVPTQLGGLTAGTDCTLIYENTTTYGALITKVTAISPVQRDGRVDAKQVYLCMNDGSTKYNVISSGYMANVESYKLGDTRPTTVFSFPDGLVLAPNISLAIAATTNYETTTHEGDKLIVLVEGGTYDQPA